MGVSSGGNGGDFRLEGGNGGGTDGLDRSGGKRTRKKAMPVRKRLGSRKKWRVVCKGSVSPYFDPLNRLDFGRVFEGDCKSFKRTSQPY